MDANNFEHDYVIGQKNNNYNEVMAKIEEMNCLVLIKKGWEKNISYGFHERECFDICYSSGKAKAILVYLHAGYWQSRDKDQFYFIADHLSELGYHVVLMNYPLCPEVSIESIRTSLSYGLLTVKAFLHNDKEDDLPLYLSGHSAGAHLTTELVLHASEKIKNTLNLKGIIPISGIYELNPLLDTSLNKNLKLDQKNALKNSPIYRITNNLVPAEFFVGGEETAAFIYQTKNMSDQWELKGNSSNFKVLKTDDHFSILFHFLGDGEILKSIERLYRLSH